MIRPGSRVLDLGCGDGALLAALKQGKSIQQLHAFFHQHIQEHYYLHLKQMIILFFHCGPMALLDGRTDNSMLQD